MQPLIDADIILYEVAFKSQSKDSETGEIIPAPWETAMQHMDNVIANICAEVYATEPPILYLTGKENFRNDLATEQPYKGNRKKDKPFHFYNLRAYVEATYNAVSVPGFEADDLMCLEQQRRLDEEGTIICSRDKDLRIQPGFHYSWEVYGQPRFGPSRVTEIGTLSLKRGGKKLFGTGKRFFYAQCLMGDSTDHIPGVRGYGPARAYKYLVEYNDIHDMETAVRELYKEKYGDEGDTKLLERGRLLHMTNELHEDGSPVLWEFDMYKPKEGDNA